MRPELLERSISKLGKDFEKIDWKYLKTSPGDKREKTQLWPGRADEDVMICVYKGKEMLESFHRQDFFFFNFAYQGDYSALSYLSNNRITIHENECYIGQPYAGYSINDSGEEEKIIVGVLIQTEAFFRTFFHVLSSDKHLFEFFLTPQINEFSEEYIRLQFEDTFSVRNLLELMIVEYAQQKEDTQSILRPLTLALLMEVAREYKKSVPQESERTLAEQIVQYIGENFDHCSLQDIAKHFSYHPNYLSGLLAKELGKTFSEILLEQRMERAVSLMKGTALPNSEIAALLGYTNSSNFYKAFREYYGVAPREYISKTNLT
ncbi:MAG: AraC family transcriptional regulator [Eubacteriales bacterium]|nr:AraC family transcriptional regulator [Eubacteriales bacterium]